MKRFLFTILAVGLALVTFQGACDAIRWSWDYTAYRVKVYINDGSDFGVKDVNNMGRDSFITWLEYAGGGSVYPKYEKIATGPMTGYEFPPSRVAPVGGASNPWEGKLKYGDVIICDDHEGVVQPNGTIAHFLRPVPILMQYDVKGLPQHWCPEPDKPHAYNESPGWRQDPIHPDDPTKDIPSCCGEFKGDSWKEFLTRSGNPRLPAICSIYREKDTDKDTVPDWADKCPDTPLNERNLVDTTHTSEWCGCGPSQRDKDKDTIMDNVDKCQNTPLPERNLVNRDRASRWYGCGPSERDSDGDGVMDDKDLCSDSPSGEAVDADGCSLRQRINLPGALTIEATDPVEQGGKAKFTASIDHSSEVDLASFTWWYEWSVDGQPRGRDKTFTGTVAENYSRGTLTATVQLWVMWQGQPISLTKRDKTVHVNQPSGTVTMSPSGRWTPEVGKQAAYWANMRDHEAPNQQTLYAYYWFLNDRERAHGYNQTTFSFAIVKGTNKVRVLVRKTSDRWVTWRKVGEDTKSFDAQGQPASSNSGTIAIVSGTYGQNCAGVPRGNDTRNLARACNGKSRCAYDISNRLFGSDPAYNCAKNYVAEFRCSNSSNVQTVTHAPVVNETYTVDLNCSAPK